MCNKKIIWVVVLVMASLSSWASANIKGNGSVVTREMQSLGLFIHSFGRKCIFFFRREY